jgi:hypothetical protein
MSVGAYDPAQEPTGAGVAARLVAITTATVFTGGLLGIGVVGGTSALTSTMGVKKDRVYADCRCLVVRGVRHGDGCYELYFAAEEDLDEKSGSVKASKSLGVPPLAHSLGLGRGLGTSVDAGDSAEETQGPQGSPLQGLDREGKC